MKRAIGNLLRTTAVVAVPTLLLLMPGCFRGGEREKEAPPGIPGGLCLGPDGRCDEGMCNRTANYCFDPTDPCKGFFCGGSDRGLCTVTAAGEPSCMCAQSFENWTYTLYCCPEDGSDPNCAGGQMPGDGGG